MDHARPHSRPVQPPPVQPQPLTRSQAQAQAQAQTHTHTHTQTHAPPHAPAPDPRKEEEKRQVSAAGEKLAPADDAEEDPDGEEEELEVDEEDDEEEEEEEEDDDEDFDNFATSEIVTVYVGVKRKRCFLHRELICQRSPFMEKCLKSRRFDEGLKNELYLPEDDPRAFYIIVDWIYRNRLPASPDPTFVLADMSAAYCMADKFGMEELQNGLLDNIRASFSPRPGEICGTPPFAVLAFTHLTGPHKSPLKRFYVEYVVHHMMKHPKWYQELRRNDQSRIDFEELLKLSDLVFYLMRKIWQFQTEPWKDPATWDKCCYHVHTTTACTIKTAATTAKKPGPGLAGHMHALGPPQRPWAPATLGVWNTGVGW